MTDKELAEQIIDGMMLNPPYHRFQIVGAMQEMARKKDSVFNGFLFELSMLLTDDNSEYGTLFRKVFPMAGLDAIDSVGDFLREEFWQFQNKGHIRKFQI